MAIGGILNQAAATTAGTINGNISILQDGATDVQVTIRSGASITWTFAEPKTIKKFLAASTNFTTSLQFTIYNSAGTTLYDNNISYATNGVQNKWIYFASPLIDVKSIRLATVGGNDCVISEFDISDLGVQTGEQLTAPEPGWKRYDNNTAYVNLSPASNWSSVAANASMFGAAQIYNPSKDATIKFKFKGTKIRFLNRTYSDQRTTVVTIDGTSEQYDPKPYGNAYQILTYEKQGLEDKVHEVAISFVDDAANSNGFDAVEIDSTGRIYHPDEVTYIGDLDVGKRIRCHYQSLISGAVGYFSGMGQETSDFIPPASSATPNGDFYFIMVENWNGQKRLIADRNIQHSISWDTLNTAGIASGSGLPYEALNGWTDNLCKGGTAIANFGGYNGKAPSNAFDGDSSTAFDGFDNQNASGHTYIGYDFGTGKHIRKLVLNQHDGIGRVTSVKVQRSSDNASWMDVGVFSVIGGINSLYLQQSTPSRYWRLVANSNTNGGISVGWLVYEVQMMEAAPNEGESFKLRLLTGGISSTDKDNEWDKYIVNSTLNGTITAGDNNVWNWKDKWTLTSTTAPSGSNANASGAGARVVRGAGSVSGFSGVPSSEAGASNDCFRPVLTIESIAPPVVNKYLFQDGNDIKKYQKSITEIPAMTKEAAGDIVITQSGSQVGFEGWRAFDKLGDSAWASSGKATASTPQWLQVDLGSPVIVSKYAITNSSRNMASPFASLDDFEFLGSNDASNWTILDTRSSEIWGNYSVRKEYALSSPASYRYYRVNVTKVTQNASGTIIESVALITEMELTFLTGNPWVVVGQSPVTKSMFDTDGMDDLSSIDKTALEQLSSNTPKVLVWTDEQDAASRNLSMTAIPKEHLIMPSGDIEAPASGVKSFTVAATADGSTALRIIASANQGATWSAWDGAKWITVSADAASVKGSGMTVDVLNALTESNWRALMKGSNKIRFAYYLDLANTADLLYVDQIAFQPSPVATETPSISSLKVTYDEMSIEGRLQDLERINAINMAKLNFKSNALLVSEKYSLYDLVIDTFETNDGIDASLTTANYDTINKRYNGTGVIVTPYEEVNSYRKQLLIVADATSDVQVAYSMNDGGTWKNGALNTLIDISNDTGNKLKIKVTLPAADSNITALAYSWA